MRGIAKLIALALKNEGFRVLSYKENKISLQGDIHVAVEKMVTTSKKTKPIMLVLFFNMRDEDGEWPIEIGQYIGDNKVVNLIKALKQYKKK